MTANEKGTAIFFYYKKDILNKKNTGEQERNKTMLINDIRKDNRFGFIAAILVVLVSVIKLLCVMRFDTINL